MTAFTQDQLELLQIINLSATVVSLLGEMMMIYSYFAIPSLKKFSFKLVISIVFADLTYSLVNLTQLFDSNEIVCFLEGFLREAAVISGILWGLIFLIIIYKQMKDYDKDIYKSYPKLLALVCRKPKLAIIH